jgi:uncharacterized coiled-coil protein SlyX
LSNTEGANNTATGFQALARNITGNSNTAVGRDALASNTSGDGNTACGISSLPSSTIGINNTAVGSSALLSNTSGNRNTVVGGQALNSNSTGNDDIALGFGAGGGVIDASNVICIGRSVPGFNVSNSCFIGNIFGAPIGADALQVSIDSTGELGTMTSSRRFKRDIQPMDKVSEAILAFRPVTFHYKSDDTNTRQFGLIAEEIAEVNHDLVVRDKSGELLTVRYDAVNAMLLNEFLKEHRKVEEQQATIAELKSTVAQQQKRFARQDGQIQALTSGIQRVGAQVEMSKPAARIVANKR